MQAQIRVSTGVIEAIGYFPDGHSDDDIEIIDLTDDQSALVLQSGTKTIADDGTITVTPPDPDVVIATLPKPTQTNEEIGAGALALATMLDDDGATREQKDAGVATAIDALSSTLNDPKATREQKDAATAGTVAASASATQATGAGAPTTLTTNVSTHTHPAPTITIGGTVDLTGLSATYNPPVSARVFARKN